MNREVNPKNILVLTFTKAAAKEMEERFHGMMPKEIKLHSEHFIVFF